MAKYNKPLNRNYFKRKANPNAKKGVELTDCCGEQVDRELVMNVKNKKDWELIEEYIENSQSTKRWYWISSQSSGY